MLTVAAAGCAVSDNAPKEAASESAPATDAQDTDAKAPPNQDTVREIEPIVGDGVQERTIRAGGLTRTYVVSLPPFVEHRERLPLVLVFHGYGQQAESLRQHSGMDRADAVVAYLQGVDNAWAPAPYAATTGEQDLAFFDAVRAELIAEYDLDPARVFVTGFSNGGGFAAYVGCQRPQEVTAVGTVAAAFYESTTAGCSAIPMKRIDFHGTEDTIMRYDGGRKYGTVYEASEANIDEAAQRNRCVGAPLISRISDEVVVRRWLDCDAETEHYRVDGGGHAWPEFATQRQLEFFGIPAR